MDIIWIKLRQNLDKVTWTGLSVVAPTKKQSLIEIAREEDPFLGIWMGPPEKLNMPEPTQNPRSKSFEVPSAKVTLASIIYLDARRLKKGVADRHP